MRKLCFILVIAMVAPPVVAETYHAGGGCGDIPNHIPDADLAATTASGVHMHSMSLPMDNITIPMEIPLNNYLDTSGINADLSETRVRPGDINVNTHTGTVSMNGQDITSQPLPNTDCGNAGGSIYSTK